MAQLLLAGNSLTTATGSSAIAGSAAATTALEQALQLVEERLLAWASNSYAFNSLLQQVFTTDNPAPEEPAAALQASLLGAGLQIALEIRPAASLSGINGAYTSAAPQGGERIYVNADWLQSASVSQLEAVLLEEIGHAIDYRLHGSKDSPGDEGEIFASLLRGQQAAASAVTENDQGFISINGTAVAIEASDTIRPTGSLGSYATAPAYAAASTNPFGITDVGYAANPILADADGDGDLDLFIGERYNATYFFRNTASPGATNPAYAAPSVNPFGIANIGYYVWYGNPTLADADGDGDLDLFIGDFYGNTAFFRNTAAAGATAPAYAAATRNPFGIETVTNYANPILADVDADGDLDLFIGNFRGNTLFFRNTASPGATNPAYAAPSTNPFGITDVGYWTSPTFTDADADGDLDLFIGEHYGSTLFFRNTAALGATAPAYAAPSANLFGIADVGDVASPTFADVDGDGDLDLFIGNYAGDTLFFRNTAATPVAPVASSTANGSYGIGALITLTLQFSEAVYVNTSGGIPRLQLETGAIDRYAIYSSGSGTNTLSFSYTVQAGDSSADLDQVSSSALELNGGTIRDAAGNNAILALAAPGAAGSLAASGALVALHH